MVKRALVVVLAMGMVACAAPADRGIERCVIAPIGQNQAGATVALMRCQPEGKPA